MLQWAILRNNTVYSEAHHTVSIANMFENIHKKKETQCLKLYLMTENLQITSVTLQQCSC